MSGVSVVVLRIETIYKAKGKSLAVLGLPLLVQGLTVLSVELLDLLHFGGLAVAVLLLGLQPLFLLLGRRLFGLLHLSCVSLFDLVLPPLDLLDVHPLFSAHCPPHVAVVFVEHLLILTLIHLAI